MTGPYVTAGSCNNQKPTCTMSILPQKLEFSADILAAMNDLKAAAAVPKWGSESPEAAAAADSSNSYGPTSRRNVFMGELRQMGIKNPDQIAVPSVRNDAAFLWTTVGAFNKATIGAEFLV
eukprot:GHUV01029045.1.p2 GENE.GHUV01029045.1~~GHUV01029045.1.p2  ORF type:complete len:121 (-),score=38.77 GHUV01029045.1:453-815(-)